MNKKEILSLLEKYEIHPKKSFGQNFLMNENVLNKIVQAAQINKNDWVIEVGPGLGVLTHKLLDKAKKVTSIELDRNVIKMLENEMKGYDNFELISMDALQYIPEAGLDYKLVANIPYNITSPLISHFLELPNKPSKIVVLIQKEVAEKICAKEGSLNVLAIHVQVFGTPKILAKVGPENFYPAPKIDSAILEIEIFKKPRIDKNHEKFFKIVHAGFSQKRKKLTNSVGAVLHKKPEEIRQILEKCGIDVNARAQHLSIEDWKVLSSFL